MELKEITNYLESIAPLAFQESYDNSGLIIGDASSEVNAALITLDCTEEVVEEAIENNCNLIISHHPIIFSGLKKITGQNYAERTIIKAIKNDIAIYAIHTNLDNVEKGVSAKIADILGVKNCKILSPKKDLLRQLVVYCPTSDAEKVRVALFDAGAGSIGNYDECSFSVKGVGRFRPGENTNPQIGSQGEIEEVEEEVMDKELETKSSKEIIKDQRKIIVSLKSRIQKISKQRDIEKQKRESKGLPISATIISVA